MFKLNCHASKLPSKCLCWYPLTKAALTPNQRSLDLQWRELNTEIHGICRCREWAASVDQPQSKHVCPQLTFRKHCGRVGWRGGSWVKGYGMSFSRLGFLVWAFVLNSRQHGQWLTFLLTFSVYCNVAFPVATPSPQPQWSQAGLPCRVKTCGHKSTCLSVEEFPTIHWQ